MHNHHYYYHHEPPHQKPLSNPPTRPEPNKHHSGESSPPLQPETPARFHDPEPELGGGGAMILSEKYYSPLMSPSETSITSPSSTMNMHMHVRDDFPPPTLSSLESHRFLSFKENEESPDDHHQHHHPSPPCNAIDQQHVRGLNWREGSPLSLPPRPPAPPPRMGILYGGASGGGGGDGGGRNKRKEGVEPVKVDVGSNTNTITNTNTNTDTDRGIFKGNKMKMGWLKKVGMGLRILELVFCVVSFSVMGSDKTQGWSGDSFDRYKEYRFCFTVNILGFAYAGLQALKLGLYFVGRNQCIINHHLCCKFDFLMDQIIAYLLMAASTAAATRVADWEANWGKDEFTKKASMSVTMAFLAFIAFACNCLISGYNIFSS